MWGIVVAITLLAAQPAPRAETLSLDEAFTLAESANLALRTARAARAVSEAERAVAREIPNPEARVELERETPRRAYAMSVPIELGGKRRRRTAVSDAALRTSEAEIAAAALETRAAVRRAYFTRVIADARVGILDEIVQLAGRARDAAAQRFEAGGVPRLEVLQARLAAAQAENDATTARGDAAAARASLNVLIGLPLDAAPTLTTPLGTGVVPSVRDALARASGANVELAVLARRVDEARARIALARALRVPDLTSEGAITRDAAPEFDTGWRAALAMTIPLFATHTAGVRLAEAGLARAQAERTAAQARIDSEIAGAAASADARRRQFVRYRDEIMPEALEVERMAEDSYRLGQTGIAALLVALQSTRDARLRMLQAGSDFHEALAALERAMGVPVP